MKNAQMNYSNNNFPCQIISYKYTFRVYIKNIPNPSAELIPDC